MPKKTKEVAYVEYAHGGIRILLPAFLKIKADAPSLWATGRRSKSSLLIQLDPEAGVQEAWESLLRSKYYTNDMLETRLIRDRDISVPYKGFERIVEHRNKSHPTGNVNYGWGLALYPENHFLQVQFSAFTVFTADEEEIWRHVLESLRVVEGWRASPGPIPSGEKLMERDLNVFADYHQFYLWDADTRPMPPMDYSEENVSNRIHTSKHAVAISPIRNETVPVRVEVHEREPAYEPDKWDHIAEASLHLPTGHLQVHECTGGPVADFHVTPGWYRVRAFYGGFDSVDKLDYSEGQDHYLVTLWPAPPSDVRVIKQWQD